MTEDNGYTLGSGTQGDGTIIDISSAGLGREMPVQVITPADYAEQPERRWPVAYLLHGVNKQAISAEGLRRLYPPALGLQALADRHRCLIVAPIVGCCWYIDDPERPAACYARFVGAELPAAIDGRYRTRAERAGRCLIGFSMGGHGAITLCGRYPATFCAAASRGGVLDLATGPRDLFWDEGHASDILGSYWRHPERYHRHSAGNLVHRLADYDESALVIEVGTEDFLLICNRRFRAHVQQLGLRHSYTETPDGHVCNHHALARLMLGLEGFGCFASDAD